MDEDSLSENDVDSIDSNDSELEFIERNFESISSNASDWGWADRTSETSPTNFLDEGNLLQVKNNNPRITSLFVTFGNQGEGLAADIDWQIEATAFVGNSYLDQLTIKEFRNNDIPSDIFDGFAKAVARSRSINHLHISEINYMEWSQTLPPLFERLRIIILDDCGVGDMSDDLLDSSVSKCIHLEKLSLENNGILDHSSSLIFKALANHCAIVDISMENNKVGVKGCTALSKLLHKPECKLEVLDLSRNDIGYEGGDFLSKAMTNNRTLKKLSIGGHNCQMHELGWRTMLANLHVCSSLVLEELIFCANRIDDAGLVSLAGVLANTTSIVSLDISYGLSTIQGETSWRTLFRQTSTLTKLSLHNTRINNEGMRALSNSLAADTATLKILDLSSSPEVQQTGWQSLFSVLANSNCTLEHLVLSRNSIGDESMTILGSALSSNTSLKKLFLEDMQHVSSEVWQSFIHSIQGSDSALEEVSLLGIDFDTDDLVIPLANMLSTNTKLKVLYVNTGAGITHPRWLAIADALCNTSSIINTYRSNHTLEEISENNVHETFIPRKLKSLLRMNTHTSKTEVARRKILRYHQPADVEEFLGMNLQVLPRALAWIGKDNRGHSALFSLLRSRPSLLGADGKGSVTGVKRQRE